MWLNEKARIAQVTNINQLPRMRWMNTSFLRVELSILIGEKKPVLSLYLVGLQPATFRLQASKPLIP